MPTIVAELLACEAESSGAIHDALASVIAASPVALAVIDRELRVELASPALAKLAGATDVDVVGRSLADVVPGGEALAVIAGDVLARGVARRDDACSLTDGHVVRVACHPIRARGRVLGVGLAITPHGPPATRRTQWTDAIRVRDQFLALVSHELRAPLAAILLWERALRQDGGDADLRERALDAIRQCAEQQSRIVEDLLDIARTLSGKLRVELHPTELAPLVVKAVDALRPEAGARTFQVDVEDGLGAIAGDAGRLQQVLSNLLSNAIKHTAPDGTVRLVARRRGDDVQIIVQDDGRGIRAAMLPYLFEPFSQDTAGAGGGLGLGLAVARQIVELHHGDIRAESDGPGRGATFTIRLPLTAADGGRAPARPKPHARLDGVRILLVDDHRDILEVLGHLLRTAGGTIESADSAAAAWRAVLEAPPDVLVTDLAMPGEDGYTLLARIREREPQGAPPMAAVALTAHASALDRARSLTAGFDAHLAKPVDFDELIATIERLGRHRQLR